MEIYTKSLRRYQPPAADAGSARRRSPRLTRSKSGNSSPAISLPDNSAFPPAHRSISTTKARTNKAYPEHLLINSTSASTARNKSKETRPEDDNKDGAFVRFLQRNTHSNNKIVEKSSVAKLKPTSPSAWALSPARSLPFPTTGPKTYSSSATTSPSAWALSPARPSPFFSAPPKASPSSTTSTSGVNGVFKYFKKKKVASIQKLECLRFSVMNNNLLQWRYVNARAEATAEAVNIVAQKKFYNVFVQILMMRNSILEKRVQMQRMKQVNKVHQILHSQDSLLKQWAKMESKNSEAVGRVIRKLSAISIRVPLADDVKGDVFLVSNAMKKATEAMNNVEATIVKFDYQVERTCYLLTELLIIVKQQKEYLVELENNVSVIASLKAEEKSLRIQLIQLDDQSRRAT